MSDEILVLCGKDADEFLKNDKKESSVEEKKDLEDALLYYMGCVIDA